MGVTRLTGTLIRTGSSVGPLSFLTVGNVTTPSGSFHVGGTTVLQQVLEKNLVSATAANGTVNFDILNQAVVYYTTNAAGNWTMNFRGNNTTTLNNVMYIGQNLTLVFLVTNGSPAYYATAHTIDGISVVPKWQGGSAPSDGSINSIDAYAYSIIKTADATFTLLASKTPFA